MTGIVSTLAALGKTDSQLITLDKSDTQDFWMSEDFIYPKNPAKACSCQEPILFLSAVIRIREKRGTTWHLTYSWNDQLILSIPSVCRSKNVHSLKTTGWDLQNGYTQPFL